MDNSIYLKPTQFIDCETPSIVEFSHQTCTGIQSDVDRGIKLYYAIRDGFRYNPYQLDYKPDAFRASTVLKKGNGFCIPKAILLAAVARAAKIPARLGFADVRNHLTTERLRKIMGTDVFYFHGYTELYLNGLWLKATPAFNLSLCKRAGVKPLEFNGMEDSIFHEYDKGGRKHMEYINQRGHYSDLPYDEFVKVFKEEYPNAAKLYKHSVTESSFEQEFS